MSTQIFGISNCDKVKAARLWLEKNNISFEFIDIRKNPITPEQWKSWLAHWDCNNLLNKRSTSWRNLSDEQKTSLDNNNAVLLLTQQPTLMKRPLLMVNDKPVHLGFKDSEYAQLFN